MRDWSVVKGGTHRGMQGSGSGTGVVRIDIRRFSGVCTRVEKGQACVQSAMQFRTTHRKDNKSTPASMGERSEQYTFGQVDVQYGNKVSEFI